MSSAAACSPLTPDAAFVGGKLGLITAVLGPPEAPALPTTVDPPASPLRSPESPSGAAPPLDSVHWERVASPTSPRSPMPRRPRPASKFLRNARASLIAELYDSARQAEVDAEAEGGTADGGAALSEGAVPAAIAAPDVTPLPSDVFGGGAAAALALDGSAASAQPQPAAPALPPPPPSHIRTIPGSQRRRKSSGTYLGGGSSSSHDGPGGASAPIGPIAPSPGPALSDVSPGASALVEADGHRVDATPAELRTE